MVKRSKGFRNRTRSKLRNKVRTKGMPPVTHALREFTEGTRVCVSLNPSIQKAMPHPRFQGQTGKVVGRQGRAYMVQITDGNKPKVLVAGPEHLKPQA